MSLVVKALDSQSRGFRLKTPGWIQSQLSLSSFRGRSNEYQELMGTECLKVNRLHVVAL